MITNLESLVYGGDWLNVDFICGQDIQLIELIEMRHLESL